eukprot:7972780-Pyramimonas_sp.AAC.1
MISKSCTYAPQKSDATALRRGPGIAPFCKEHAIHPSKRDRVFKSWMHALQKTHARAPVRKWSQSPSVLVVAPYGTPGRRGRGRVK